MVWLELPDIHFHAYVSQNLGFVCITGLRSHPGTILYYFIIFYTLCNLLTHFVYVSFCGDWPVLYLMWPALSCNSIRTLFLF
jgi:hypothetical protein